MTGVKVRNGMVTFVPVHVDHDSAELGDPGHLLSRCAQPAQASPLSRRSKPTAGPGNRVGVSRSQAHQLELINGVVRLPHALGV